MKHLFEFLKVKNRPCKHWFDSIGWQIVKTMHQIIIKSIEVVVQNAKYIVVNCDEVTTIDNQS
jgi:hypothetical protein